MKKNVLRTYRKSQNWTLKEASRRYGLSLSYLSELERGVAPMTLEAAKKIEKKTGGGLLAVSLLGLKADA